MLPSNVIIQLCTSPQSRILMSKHDLDDLCLNKCIFLQKKSSVSWLYRNIFVRDFFFLLPLYMFFFSLTVHILGMNKKNTWQGIIQLSAISQCTLATVILHSRSNQNKIRGKKYPNHSTMKNTAKHTYQNFLLLNVCIGRGQAFLQVGI